MVTTSCRRQLSQRRSVRTVTTHQNIVENERVSRRVAIYHRFCRLSPLFAVDIDTKSHIGTIQHLPTVTLQGRIYEKRKITSGRRVNRTPHPAWFTQQRTDRQSTSIKETAAKKNPKVVSIGLIIMARSVGHELIP